MCMCVLCVVKLQIQKEQPPIQKMESNEITMAVDVKLDLKDRRSEFHQFRVSPILCLIIYFNI